MRGEVRAGQSQAGGLSRQRVPRRAPIAPPHPASVCSQHFVVFSQHSACTQPPHLVVDGHLVTLEQLVLQGWGGRVGPGRGPRQTLDHAQGSGGVGTGAWKAGRVSGGKVPAGPLASPPQRPKLAPAPPGRWRSSRRSRGSPAWPCTPPYMLPPSLPQASPTWKVEVKPSKPRYPSISSRPKVDEDAPACLLLTDPVIRKSVQPSVMAAAFR